MSLLTHMQKLHNDMIQWRQHLHAYPELGFEEHETSKLVINVLKQAGFEVHPGIGGTGVVGCLKVGNSSRTVGLRADMDALPIEEANSFAYRSRHSNTMHACGHDGHMAMLLGAAVYLAEIKSFNGTVNLIFQPAEEGMGGAAAMIADGLFQRFPCDAIYAMHNKPGLAAGRFGIFRGPMMAGGAVFEIKISGTGCHAARPDRGTDTVLAASHIVVALQSVVARTLDPCSPAVLSVTQIHGGDAMNIIPQAVHLRGTARCFSKADMALIEARIRKIASSVCDALGAQADVQFEHIFPPLINHAKESELAYALCCELVGEALVDENLPLVMASEDFALMLEQTPGCYINIGNGLYGSAHGGCDVHNPLYDFNDTILPLGASFFVGIAQRQLL